MPSKRPDDLAVMRCVRRGAATNPRVLACLALVCASCGGKTDLGARSSGPAMGALGSTSISSSTSTSVEATSSTTTAIWTSETIVGEGSPTPSVAPNGVNVAFAVVVTSLAEQIAFAPVGGTTSAQSAQLVTPAAAGSARKPAWGQVNVIAFEHGAPNSATWRISTPTIAVSTAPGATPCDVVLGPGDNRNPSWAPPGWVP